MEVNKSAYAEFYGIALGDYSEGSYWQSIVLELDEKGFYIKESYFVRERFDEIVLNTKYFDARFPQSTSFNKFVNFIEKNYPKYNPRKYLMNNDNCLKRLQALFMQ